MRRVMSAVGRSLWALVVLALTAVVVVAAYRYPAATPEAVPDTLVEVPPSATVLVCPGPVRLPTELEPGDDIAYDPAFDPTPSRSVAELVALTTRPGTGSAADAVLRPLGSDSGDVGVTATDPARVPDPTGSVVLRAEAVDDAPAWLSGSLHVSTDAGDLRGLVSAPCQAPSTESWLVGGSTVLGSSARLVLQNPGATPAVVTVSLWGASGPVELAGSPEYLVPAGSERSVLLEGVAAEQSRIVVRTVAEGGLVTAYLQDSRLRGLVPSGVDDVVAGQAPALTQVVPGVSLAEQVQDAADAPVLRVLAPDAEAGNVDVVLLGADGPVTVPGAATQLDSGVLDIPLGGIPAGHYTAVVTADVPVVAGVMLARTGPAAASGDEAPSDRAWAPSVAPGQPGPLALPDGVPGRLLLAAVPALDAGPDAGLDAGGPLEVEIEVVTEDGVAVVDRSVPEGGTVAIDLADLADGGLVGVTVRGDDARLAWAVVLDTGEMVSVLAPVPPRESQPSVAVRVR